MASGSLGSLVVSLAVDTARFQGDLGRAAAITERRMKNIKDTASRAFAAFAVAATAAGTALAVMVGKSLRDADSLLEMSQALGTTVEELSALRFAAGTAGVSQEELGVSLKKLASFATDAANGLKAPAAAFKALGISVRDTDGNIKGQLPLIKEIAEVYKNAPDGILKTASATDFFGKSGARLIPLLNEGAAGVQRLMTRAEELGQVISTETAVAADQFADSLGELKALATGFSNLLAAELAPTLANFTTELSRSQHGVTALHEAAEFFANFLRVLLSGLLIIKHTFVQLGEGIGSIAAAFMAAARGEFKQAWDILGESSARGAQDHERFITQLLDIWDKTAQQTYSAAPRLGAQLAAPAKEAAKQTKESVEEMQKFLNQANQMAIDASRITQPLVPQGGGDENTMAINAAMEAIRNDSLEMGEAYKETITEMSVFTDEAARSIQGSLADFLFAPANKGFKGMLKGFVDVIRRMVAEAASAQILKALFGDSAGGGGLSGFLGTLFAGIGGGGGAVGGMAGGGSISAGSMKWVGEKGPELFRPRTSGTVIPNHAIGGTVVNFAPVTNIDSRTDQNAIRQYVNLSHQENNRQLLREMTNMRSRGANI